MGKTKASAQAEAFKVYGGPDITLPKFLQLQSSALLVLCNYKGKSRESKQLELTFTGQNPMVFLATCLHIATELDIKPGFSYE
jgi:hypothetical protein